jgi:hypothetical protein
VSHNRIFSCEVGGCYGYQRGGAKWRIDQKGRKRECHRFKRGKIHMVFLQRPVCDGKPSRMRGGHHLHIGATTASIERGKRRL